MFLYMPKSAAKNAPLASIGMDYEGAAEVHIRKYSREMSI